MTSMQGSASTGSTGSTGGPAQGGKRALHIAWISVALIPVAFVAAMFVGEGLLTLQGYEPEPGEFPPLGTALRAALPAGLLMMAPAVTAVVFGFRAHRRGMPTAVIPAVIGILVVVYGIVANTMSWLLGA